MERLAGGTSSDEVLRYLSGVEFPAKKDRLVHAARQNGAPNDVVAALSALPATDFSNAQEVIDSYPHMEG
jgi:Protein of unknown function (DUF2795)